MGKANCWSTNFVLDEFLISTTDLREKLTAVWVNPLLQVKAQYKCRLNSTLLFDVLTKSHPVAVIKTGVLYLRHLKLADLNIFFKKLTERELAPDEHLSPFI